MAPARTLGWVGALLLVLPILSSLKPSLESALRNDPQGWQDEGYVLAPALRVYEGGPGAYRCREVRPTVCYGSTQVFLDAALLRLLPDHWVERGRLADDPGTRWFYKSEYPEAIRILRLTRWLAALGLLIAIGVFLAKSGVPRGWAVFAAMALGCLQSFEQAQSGLKNDLLSGVWILAFLLLAVRALGRREGRLRAAIAAVVCGVLAMGVKPTVLPAFLLFLLFFSLSAAGVSRQVGKMAKATCVSAIRDVAVLLGVAGAFYLILNPNAWVSLTEAAWLRTFSAMGGHLPTASRLKDEFLHVFVPSLAPLAPLFPLVWMGVRSKTVSPKWLFLMATLGAWAVLNLKGSFHRAIYYVPVWVAGVALAGVLWRELSRAGALTPWLKAICATALAVPALLHAVGDYRAGAAGRVLGNWPGWSTHPHEWEERIESRPDIRRWYVDGMLRVAIPERFADRVEYFDSLSLSPSRLAARIREQGGESSAAAAAIAVACWSDASASPAAVEWERLTREMCGRAEPLGLHLTSFDTGKRVEASTVILAAALFEHASAKRELPLLFPQEEGLHPRFLEGAWEGIDFWYAPLVLYRDGTQLGGRFVAPTAAVGLEIPLESTCKGRGSLTATVSRTRSAAEGRVVVRKSLDTRPAVCAATPWVCRLGIEDWWTRRQAVEPMTIPLPLEKGEEFSIRIVAEGLDSARCRAMLGKISLRPE